MRKGIFLIVLMSIIGLSCKKASELTQFDMDYESKVSIPSSVGVNLPVNFPTPDITSNSESQFSGKNTSKDLIDKIALKSIKLSITTPESGNFDFLKSIEVYLKADGLDPVMIASKTSIPDGLGKVLELETSGADIKEFIKKDKFKLDVKTVTDKLITQDHELKINAVFFVDAKILGL
ncbi:hypothetical protein MASR2M44_26010 [Bacteroidota bacterium]